MVHVLRLSYSDVDALGTGALITRMTSDINQVQNGVNLTLRLLLRSPFVVFGAMIMAFTIDYQSALVFAGVIPLLCVIVFGIMLVTMPLYRRVGARQGGGASCQGGGHKEKALPGEEAGAMGKGLLPGKPDSRGF